MLKIQPNWQKRRVIYFATIVLLLVLLVGLMILRKPIGDYSDPSGPFYKGDYANTPGQFDGSLRVVTWNLHYAEKLDEVISALENAKQLQDADVLLLQEVNLKGVEAIAQKLHDNYVYYPAAYHRERREEYGNAILTKWPITDPEKLALPNWLPGWLESRNAAKTRISVGEREILVYSVHLDVFWMVPGWVKSQGEFLVEEASNEDAFVIQGGDYNTWNAGSIAVLEKEYSEAGLERLTTGTGYTFESSVLKLTLDHIFSTEVNAYQSGVYRHTDASDHFPVWADILFKW